MTLLDPDCSGPIETTDLNVAGQYEQILLATALGDSLGVPFENMSGNRVRKILRGRLSQRFMLDRGMISDDTEHALLTARALMDSHDDPARFEHALSSRLKRWLAAFPPGVGKATLLSIVSMVFRKPSEAGRPSAGNGPLMRAPIIGRYHANNKLLRDSFVRLSTRMTHTDPRATFIASGVADIAASSAGTRLSWRVMSKLFREAAVRHASASDAAHVSELNGLLDALDESDGASLSVPEALSRIGCSKAVDGYAYRSGLAAAYVASHASSVKDAIFQAISQGGDTDSTAALAGALAAANGQSVSHCAMDEILDWPFTLSYLQQHAQGLGQRNTCTIKEPCYPLQVLRNLLFFWVAVGHISRRLLPPY